MRSGVTKVGASVGRSSNRQDDGEGAQQGKHDPRLGSGDGGRAQGQSSKWEVTWMDRFVQIKSIFWVKKGDFRAIGY